VDLLLAPGQVGPAAAAHQQDRKLIGALARARPSICCVAPSGCCAIGRSDIVDERGQEERADAPLDVASTFKEPAGPGQSDCFDVTIDRGCAPGGNWNRSLE
jgi:hypothetical protein